MRKKSGKNGKKKGEATAEILEEIKNKPGITKGELEGIYKHTTVWYNIYSNKAPLKNKIRIEKNAMGVDTYYAIKTEGDVGSEYLHFLMENYKSSSAFRDRIKQIEILSDINAVCHEKKIRDKEFIKFLIEYSSKREKWEIDFSKTRHPHLDHKRRHGVECHDNIFWLCLRAVALKLVLDIESDESDNTRFEKDLLDLIRSTRSFFEEIIFEHTRNPSERVLALDVLRNMNMLHPKRFDIAFKLLEYVDTEKALDFSSSQSLMFDMKPNAKGTELDIFRRQIESLILSYAKFDPIDCRKQLYSLLEANSGSEICLSLREAGSELSVSKKQSGIQFTAREMKIKEEIMYLLEATRKKQYMP